MQYSLRLLRVFFLVALLFGCKDDPVLPDPPPVAEEGHSVFVLNEGNYQSGNASVTSINLQSGAITEDMFHQSNHRPVGDVLQSLSVVNGEGWLVVNNSQKIERVNLRSMEAMQPITGFNSPRFVLEVSPQKAYVTDLYANQIHIVNVASGAISGHIPCPGWTEQLILTGNEAWVCNVRKNKVYVINTVTDRLIDSVSVGDEPASIVQDSENRIWVLCGGKIPPGETAGSLWRIDPSTHAVLYSLPFPSVSIHPARLKLNAAKTSLYFIYKDVFRIGITDTELPSTPVISSGNKLLYGLGIRSQDDEIWVSDARDFVQKGAVFRYSASGAMLNTYEVGFIPGSFYFY